MKQIVYIVIFAAALIVVDAKDLPSYVEACRKDDPKLNECAKQHAINSIPSILKGDKEYKVPEMLPLLIPEILLKPNPEFTMKLKNTYLKGLDTFEVQDVKINLEKQHAELYISFKSIVLEGQYEVDGKILVLPISGKGPAKITCDNLAVKYTIDYKLKMVDGTEYVDTSNLESAVTYTTENIVFKFDNLFNGDKNLGDKLNEFLNEHATEINDDFSSSIAEIIRTIATQTVKNTVPDVPYSKIFI